ncbi:MAG: patatin-like phospholipase family protein [Kiritimatiellae bacterium]|nr:patatin-like phospholipase family protein [Kiritimatiellia bacterium]
MSAKRNHPPRPGLSRVGRSLDGVLSRLAQSAAPVLEEAAALARKYHAASPAATDSAPAAEVVREHIAPARLARAAKAKGLHARRVGLALGSGGARGFAHLGVLRALSAAGIRPCCIAGTSMGAVVGAFAAAGKAEELAAYVLSLDWPRIVRYGDVAWPLRQGGLFKGNVFRKELAKRLGVATFGELAVPFAAVATDVESGARVVMREGDLALAVRASASIPGLFAPVRDRDRWLIDGAFTDPIPVGEARALGAAKVLAVDASPEVSRADPNAGRPGVREILLQAMSIAEAGLARVRGEGERADWLVRPPVGRFATLAFDRAAEIVEAGYRATAAFLVSDT